MIAPKCARELAFVFDVEGNSMPRLFMAGRSTKSTRSPAASISSTIVLFVLLAASAPAQAQESIQCAAGLMRRDQAESGTLLLRTTTPGCYLGAPRVAADISV